MSSRHHASRGWSGKSGGASRDRTGDLLLAKQALSQLSYGPAGLVLGYHSAPEGLLSSTHVGKDESSSSSAPSGKFFDNYT